MKSSNPIRWKYFSLGVWESVLGLLIFQDFLGKDAYLRHVEENWVDPTISGPISVVALVLVVLYHMYLESTVKE